MIGVGATTNDGTGDPLRTALTKTNSNFTELYSSTIAKISVAPQGATPVDAALQTTINTLAAVGGGTLILGAGTYTLNNPVTMANNVSIVGVATAFPPSTNLLSNTWTPSGGTIIVAGSATQGFIWNTTDLGSVTNWGANQLSGVVLENLCFSGFTGQGLKIGAKNAEGLVMSRLRHLAFYNCGTQGSTYETGATYGLELRNYAGINVSEIYAAKCANGLLFRVSVATATQQLGNSTFTDIQVDTQALASPNFSRPIVIGTDPGVATSFSNQIRGSSIAVYSYLRSTITGTASMAGGTTFTLSAGTITNFPVGMPVKFTTGSGNIAAGVTYFVLSNNGTNLSVGSSRGGAALTLPTLSPTITQLGYPLLDLGGLITTTLGQPNSIFQGLDLEGSALGSIYAENCLGLDLHINQITNGSGTGIVLRSSQAIVRSYGSAFAIDDSSGSVIVFGGVLKSPQPFLPYPVGLYSDGTNSVPGFSIGTGLQTTVAAPNFVVKGNNGFIYPNAPFGETVQASLTATATVGIIRSGLYNCEQASAATYTFSAALTNAAIISSQVGARFWFNNVGAGNATIVPSTNAAGNLINNTAHTNNQVLLTPGQWAYFVGSLSSGGTTYWSVITNGTIS